MLIKMYSDKFVSILFCGLRMTNPQEVALPPGERISRSQHQQLFVSSESFLAQKNSCARTVFENGALDLFTFTSKNF